MSIVESSFRRRARKSAVDTSSKRQLSFSVAVIALVVGVLTLVPISPAAQAASSGDYTQLSLGYDRACAVTGDGHVKCWGAPSEGNVSGSDKVAGTTGAFTVPGVGGTGTLDNISQVDMNGYEYGSEAHVCATGDGSVYCWGFNENGQLGDGTNTDSLTPVQVQGVGGTGYLSDVVKIAVNDYGYAYSCAVTSGGSVYCWGYNDDGELGDGTTNDRNTPVQVRGVGGTGYLSDIIDIGLSEESACALSETGSVYCWGYNNDGQLGDGTTTDSLTPVQVKGVGGTGFLSNVASMQVSNLEDYVCAVTTGGSVYCWGYNSNGRLGDGTQTDRHTPVQVVGVGGTGTLSGISKVFLADDDGTTCAVSNAGAAYCWGSNYSGELGNGTTGASSSPVQVKGVGGTGTLSNVSSMSTGDSTTCAVTVSGSAYCWGYNNYGELGDGTDTNSTTPVQVKGVDGVGTLGGVTSIVVSTNDYVCATTDDKGYCWGNNYEAELANGGVQPEAVFTPGVIEDYVSYGAQNGLDGIEDLGDPGSSDTTCVIGRGGTVYCWGQGDDGELGDGTSTENRVRTQVTGVDGEGYLTGITKLSYSDHTMCALHESGTVYCWGNNDRGQLGDGTTINRNTPVPVKGVGGTGLLTNIVDITVESFITTCALDADGNVYCWGRGSHGQLGNNSTSDSATPVQVKGVGGTGNLGDIVDIEGGNYFTCAISEGGSLYCWGANDFGILGNGNSTQQTTPVQVKGVGGTGFLSGVTAVAKAADGGFICAIADGEDQNVYCWGYNANGQLGNGTTSSSSTPVQVQGVGGTGFLNGIVQITHNGNGNACARNQAGAVYCWGVNGGGQLGVGTTVDSSTPVQVKGVGGTGTLSDIVDIRTTGNFSCATNTDGEVFCWGGNSSGQLGNQTYDVDGLLPTPVKGPDGVGTLSGVAQVRLLSGKSNACALTETGVVYCWGYNYYGSTGNRWAIATTVPYGVATPAPNSPTQVTATAGASKATVSWTAPGYAGNSAITGYIITPYINGVAQTPVSYSGTGTTRIVTGLTPGTAYTFTVHAYNDDGHGATSTQSNSVTPFALPGTPGTPTATAGQGEVSLQWSAPQGHVTITGYRITPYIDGVAQSPVSSMGTGVSHTVTGLINGVAYTFTVAAFNNGGTGDASNESNEVTPTAPPGAVSNLMVSGTSTHEAIVSWAPPSDTGGLPITKYVLEYRKASSDSWTLASDDATSPMGLLDLESATDYVVRVIAVNSLGNGVEATVAFKTLALMPSPGISAPIAIVDGIAVPVPAYTELTSPVAGIATTPSANGSWTVTADGGVFTAGDAEFHGSMGGTSLNSPMIGIAPTPTGSGYLLVGSDGGVFAYGDANFHGSMGGTTLNKPVTGIASTCSNSGYFLVADDGGVFAFGDAAFHGSMAGVPLNDGMLGIVPACDNSGYWTYAKDGGVFTFGNAQFYGSLGSNPPPGGVIGMVSASDGKGYWLIGADKKAYAFGSAAVG